MLHIQFTPAPRRRLLTPTHTRAGRRLSVPRAIVSDEARAAILTLSDGPRLLPTTTRAKGTLYAQMLERGTQIVHTLTHDKNVERFPIPKEA